jgi:carbon monoxide dehydrogenase subunit G
MQGAEITEKVDETHYKGMVRSRIGPATMAFSGTIEVLDLDVEKRLLNFVGKGADKTGSSASMDLSARIESGETPNSSVMVGVAKITVSGKLAQFGSRLIMPVADAMLQKFIESFRAKAADLAGGPSQAAPGSVGSDASTSRPKQAAKPSELNVFQLIWMVIKGWFSKK